MTSRGSRFGWSWQSALLILFALLLAACERREPAQKVQSSVTVEPPACTADSECGHGPCVQGVCLVCETIDFDFDGNAEPIASGANVRDSYAPELSISARVRGRPAVPTAEDAHGAPHSTPDNVLVARRHDRHSGRHDHGREESVFEFSFAHPVCAASIDIVGLARHEHAKVSLRDASGDELVEFTGTSRGDEVDLDSTCDVSRIVVAVSGSAALDNLRVCGESAPLDRCSRVVPGGVSDVFTPVTGPAGRLTIAAMSDAPDPFSPDSNGVADETTLSATAQVAPPLRRLSSIPFEYQILDGLTCAPVRVVDGRAAVRGNGSATLEAVWNGEDRHGDIAPDGVYFYRLFADLLKHDKGHGHARRGGHDHGRHGHDGDRREVDSVQTGFLKVVLDNSPLRIFVENPRLDGQPPSVQWDARVLGTNLEISGRVEPPRELRSLDVFLNGASIAVDVTPLGRFSASGTLNVSGLGPVIQNFVTIAAVDDLGQPTSVEFIVNVRIDDVVPGRLLTTFHPDATEDTIRAAVSSVGATIVQRSRATREAVLAMDVSADPRDVAAQLRTDAAIATAVPSGVEDVDGLCDPAPASTDPQRNTPGQYYLNNNGDLVAFSQGGMRCRAGSAATDCGNPQDECVVGICVLSNTGVARYNGSASIVCTTDADCLAAVGPAASCSSRQLCLSSGGSLTGTACTSDANCSGADPGATCVNTGLCGKTSVADADLGWEDASTEVCDIQQNGPEIIVAFFEPAGISNVNHRDLQTRVWTNFRECGGTACTNNGQCVAALGAGSTCIQNQRCDGPDADLLPDCAQGAATPGDGCPGLCGDDDGDGFADGADPEVQELLERLNGNCNDDDDDGSVDDSRPAIPVVGTAESNCTNCVDDDNDGVKDDGCAAIAANGTPESALIQEDDDENGYIDDIHGFHFAAAFRTGGGERDGSTHPAGIVNITGDHYHASLVASSTASQLDNGVELAGLNPGARLMTLSGGTDYFIDAIRYADKNGARVVSMSWGWYACTCGATCTGTARTNYDNCVRDWERKFRDALSPSMAYFISAGNSRFNLTTDPVPDASGNCPASGCRWRFPQNVGTYLDANGNPITAASGTPFNVVIAAADMRGGLADHYLGGSGSYGSNIGTVVSGGSAVDFASLTDNIDYVTFNATTGVTRSTGATSFATPTAAGVASFVIAQFPDVFDRRPAKLLDRLRATLAPCAAPAAGLRGCTGNMLTPGRIDLFNAIDTATFPLPGLATWEDESWRLGDNSLSLTHDVDFVDSDGNGTVEFIFEVFGGPALEQAQPKIHWSDPVTGTFSDQTTTRLLSDLTGNYNKAVAGDVNGDDCTDLVLAGFLSPATAPDPFQGQSNRLVFQNASGSTCLGTFTDVTNQLASGVPRLPTRNDITRDVDLFDMDGDTDLDILFTNATFPAPGGAFGDQLLENNNGAFTDVSDQLDITVTGDAHKASATCFVNADMFPDVVQAVNGANRILINDGTGNFTNEAVARGLPASSGFSHDVECHDFFQADGSLGSDGRPEIIFARRSALTNLMYLNDGAGVFSDISTKLGAFTDTTQEVEICELDGAGPPEILVGNGDIETLSSESNRALRYNASTGNFDDATTALGFHFGSIIDLTEDIECADLDNSGGVDAVLIGNTGQRNWLYRRH